MDNLTVAVLGTGIMGEPIARNLLRAGLGVRAWNRTRAKAEPLADDGAVVCDEAAEAADGADVVVTMLLDGDAVEQVIAGVLPAMEEGAIWVQMSTVGAEAADRLAELARSRGVPYVDSPVLGTRKPAEDGALVVLASGPRDERVGRVFEAIGSRTMWIGEGTEASRLKLVANSWVLALTSAIGEAVALAEAFDLDPRLFLQAIEGGLMDTPYAHLKGEAIIKRELPASFPLTGAAKDAGLVAAAGRAAGANPRIADTAREQFRRAIELGHGDEDMAAVYYAARRTDGAEIRE
ncbi:NAD(P)-dependent oxidoreductase [Actinoallomurus iriomotensis]|uniref:3-hydroxyisobutyrate dehydrogenase n=1 Tax=Actinoallomurus iriomotensis TaxID=478107 RepID=A0A9W6RRB4_9ACTN|nr:NAD(P)-dependent oxidoreductase [Actinoallomurus iriomotensis]GLY81101.1 3-hydroxyisobutyrate dehydrogenase [Actinoallomurus iriomotensis]